MAKYSTHFGLRATPQSEPIPGRERDMVKNDAGGFTFQVDDWTRLRRFLVLGSEGGSYYAGERQLTQDNARAVMRLLVDRGADVVAEAVAVSEAGRAPSNSPAIFVLALAAASSSLEVRQTALQALPRVCRTGAHLLEFTRYAKDLRGWGRGLRRAIAAWFVERDPDALAYQVAKYQQRDGWSMHDLLRIAHPGVHGPDPTPQHRAVFDWICGREADPDIVPERLLGVDAVKRASSAGTVGSLILGYGLTREMVPTRWLNEPAVWEALLQQMPLGALVRNLANLTRRGVLVDERPEIVRQVVTSLTDRGRIKRARLHPMSVLLALKTYGSGQGFRSRGARWTPVGRVVDALSQAFYLAFEAVEPTGRRILLAVDASMSMDYPIANSNITVREAAVAQALVTASTEPDYTLIYFTSGEHVGPLPITPMQRMSDAMAALERWVQGLGTDCALPILWAEEKRLAVDAFVLLTDNQSWAGNIHVTQALLRYRQKINPAARLVVVAMRANRFSVADQGAEVTGMLDVVGFDTSVPQVLREFILGSV